MRGISANGRNTVQGTFDDLSEEEKTRAYLQFLQYHQQLEQENKTKRFQQMLNRDHDIEGDFFNNSEQDNESLDDKEDMPTASKADRLAFKFLILILVVFQL